MKNVREKKERRFVGNGERERERERRGEVNKTQVY